MENQQDPSLHPQPRTTLQAVTKFRFDETTRWRRRIISLVFVGLLISLLIHLNIGLLLSFLHRRGDGIPSIGAMTTVEFAIQDSQTLTELPQGEQLQAQETAQTEATDDVLDSTQAMLIADESGATLDATTQSMPPSLAGGGSTGIGAGMGGSGGGGTSFFGISSEGTRFCYIVDISGSMAGGRLDAAMTELSTSLKMLPDFSRFYILFYSSVVDEPDAQQGWNTARATTVRRIIKELHLVVASGGTEPMPAFEQAFLLDPLPEIVYFLTDGQISGFSLEVLRSIIPNNKRIVINTIAFGNNASQQLLQDIALMTGGQYRFVQTGKAP